MSVLLAAVQILKKSGSPLHAKDLASQMIAEGLWKSDGKTPAATVSARLYSDIKNNGDKSPFEKVGPQIFTLINSLKKFSGKAQWCTGDQIVSRRQYESWPEAGRAEEHVAFV